MKRVNQMRMYRLGALSKLKEIGPITAVEIFFAKTYSSRLQLEAFIGNAEYQRNLPRAVEKAKALEGTLAEIYSCKRPLAEGDIGQVEIQLLQFESSLDDDLARCHIYEVDPVGAYSFDRLIGAADTVFPLAWRTTLIPEQVLTDFRSAGRCLAFDLPTACGFHAFRATDAMLCAYCTYFGAEPKGHGRDWGRYIVALREALKKEAAIKKPNQRTVELLDNIRATDRNPLVHPELNLDADGALLMFDLCKNAIGLMVTDIKTSS
jgi:hypothetical protein